MGAKLYADSATKNLIMTASPDTTGLVALDVQVDVWSDLVEDWESDLTLRGHTFPVQAIGGQTVTAGQLGTTYVLLDPWQLDPDLSSDVEVGVDNDSQIAIYGAGAGESVAQSGMMPHDGNIPDLHARVRRVGTPTDSLRVSVYGSLGGTQLQTTTIDGDLLPTTIPSQGVYIGFDTPADLDSGTPLYVVFERTGARDATNYYELCVDDSDPWPGGTVWESDTGVWTEDTGKDLCIHVHIEVPYELQITGNFFTDTARPVVIPTPNINTVMIVSTLVEKVTTDTSGLTPTESSDLSRMRKWMTNAQRLAEGTVGNFEMWDDGDDPDVDTPLETQDVTDVDGNAIALPAGTPARRSEAT